MEQNLFTGIYVKSKTNFEISNFTFQILINKIYIKNKADANT